jgi:hypothetical protein
MAKTHWLVEALVERLQPIVPPEVCVVDESGDGGGVLINGGRNAYVREIADQPHVRGVESAISNVLTVLEEEVSENLGYPWPSLNGDVFVERRGAEIHAGWVGPDGPVLELAPIPLPTSGVKYSVARTFSNAP